MGGRSKKWTARKQSTSANLFSTGNSSPNLKPIRNPITAVVDCLGGKLYPEPLLVTTPLTQGITSQQEREQIEQNDPIKAAIDQVHLWSNWPRAKRKHARWVSLYGEAFVKVVADPLAGRVYYELIEPQYVTDYSIDVRDFITSCRLDIPQADVTQAGTKHWVHTEQWDKDLQTVRVWRTDGTLDAVANRALWDLGQPAQEMPHCPTRPLLLAAFFTSQSIVSHVSVLSLGRGDPFTYGTW